jgi:hypothetical protein
MSIRVNETREKIKYFYIIYLFCIPYIVLESILNFQC